MTSRAGFWAPQVWATKASARPNSTSEPGSYDYSRPGEIVRCPWHGWEFDVRTGRSWCDPKRMRLMNYAVTVEPGAKLVEGPYVAETFAVAVEDDYVVVETK